MATHYDEDKFVQRYAERFKLKLDEDWSYRECRLFILQKFLNGSIYDNLEPFYKEYTDGNAKTGKYIPLSSRRPSVIYNLPKIITDAASSMLFGEGHFPIPRCEDEAVTEYLQYITRISDLRGIMLDAVKKGAIGSSVILVKVLEGKFFFEAIHSTHLTPFFDQKNPKDLERLIDKKKVDGSSLMSEGYAVAKDDKNKQFWIVREWTKTEEIYYVPYKVDDAKDEDFMPQRDDERSSKHDLGFVPCIWVKNLPKSTGIDGHSTFEDIIDICIEINYQLSQHGRLLKYNSDPTLVIKNPQSIGEMELKKGLTPLILDEKGDAKLLEISSGATQAVMDYVKCLRELALEMVRGNRSNPDKLHSAQSGEALKMLHAELISLVDEMRLTYGEYALVKLYNMVMMISNSKNIQLGYDEPIPAFSGKETDLVLDWPAWYPPTPKDKFDEANTLSSLTTNGIISKETATKTVADEYGIMDIEAERREVEESEEKEYDREMTKKTLVASPKSVDRKQDKGAKDVGTRSRAKARSKRK